MKSIFRSIIVEALVLYLIAQATTGLNFSGGYWAIFATGVALALATLLVKPIVNILLLPINLVTFGLFKWIGNAVTLYIVDLVLDQFKVGEFSFSGFSNEWITLPAYHTNSMILSYIFFSFIIFFVAGIIYWLIK
ncbi:phage holin family protein [Candidatus Microgenomates bacterium]|nr:phage holin family protein [Candidatus Microgenomates bacterium]